MAGTPQGRRRVATAIVSAAVLATVWAATPAVDPGKPVGTITASANSTSAEATESAARFDTGPAPGATTGPAPADASPLVVALDFVVPAYQGGAERFRTPATIDTALAEDLGKRLQRPVTIVGPGAVIEGSDAGIEGPEIEGLEIEGPDAAIDSPDRMIEIVEGKAGSEREAVAMRADIRIAPLDGRPLPPDVDAIPLDYRAAPMAILRTDSPIRTWHELQGRTVCVAVGGQHVGDLERQYGATEIVHPSPTDALIAVRVGQCDVMVHDSALLERLIRLPEWKKFSKTLPPRPATTLALLAPRGRPDVTRRLQRIAADWRATGFVDGLLANAVRNIAFEVYLQQEVPDCH